MTSITDIPGLRVGHWTNRDGGTGCTVLLCESGPVAGVDVRGAAPATRETDLLRPGSLVGRVHAILLTGGSAFGLDAATGVMRYLEERSVGFPTGAGPVPIVAAAALFDLSFGRSEVRPDAQAGYAACRAADEPLAEGTVGAGTGATVAHGTIKGGIGTAAHRLADGTLVAALVAVNAVGSIYDNGQPIAAQPEDTSVPEPFARANTTIGIVATTAPLDSGAVSRLALQAHDGLARAIRPAHTQYDGDALFAVSLPAEGGASADPLQLGAAAADVVAEAIIRGVRLATTLHGVAAVAG
jgi:L-aminopeptidase/D-esterase-like protein